MTDSWDRTVFDAELSSLLEGKLPVSASKITALQTLATTHPQHHNYITQCIARFIERAPPDYRLAGLYVVDAISRAVHKQQRKKEENNEQKSTELDGYLKRFAIVLKESSLRGCFESCSQKDKEKARKTLDFWEQGNIYSKDTVDYVKNSFFNTVTTTKAEDNKTKAEVDTAKLLATLSNIGNGSLAATLNIPGLNAPSMPQPALTQQQPASGDGAQEATTQKADDSLLPPALAKLLGNLVSTTPPGSSTPTPPVSMPASTAMADIPKTLAPVQDETLKEPVEPAKKQGVWPPPQGPSLPRKSRWNSSNDTNNKDRPVPMASTTPAAPFYSQMTGQQGFNNNSHPSSQQKIPYNHQQSGQYYASSPPPPPPPTQGRPPMYQQRQPYSYKGREPMPDTTLPLGCIRVLTRTLFVGPIPDHFEREDVERHFRKYGELASVIVSKKFRGKHNAFLKYTTRASTEKAKYEADGMKLEHNHVKVNWAFGFGPKKHFNFDSGESIIPLTELSGEEKHSLQHAPVGGFHGQPVREQMVIEEPEAEYKKEWKMDTNNNSNNYDSRDSGEFAGHGGFRGGHRPFNNNRYQDRYNNPRGGIDGIRRPHHQQHYQQQQHYEDSDHSLKRPSSYHSNDEEMKNKKSRFNQDHSSPPPSATATSPMASSSYYDGNYYNQMAAAANYYANYQQQPPEMMGAMNAMMGNNYAAAAAAAAAAMQQHQPFYQQQSQPDQQQQQQQQASYYQQPPYESPQQ